MNTGLDAAFAGRLPECKRLGTARVYIMDASLLEEPREHPEWEQWCSGQKWKKICRCQSEQGRRNGVGAVLLTGYVFREEKVPFSPCDIIYGPHGKPYHAGLHFNLSHSGRYVICAVADNEIGCDIQKIKPCRENMLRRFFSQEDADYILSAAHGERDRRFTRLWGRKESYFKMTGEGLTKELRNYSFVSEGGFYEMELEDYMITVYTKPAERFCKDKDD